MRFHGFPLDIARALGYEKFQQHFVIPLDFMLALASSQASEDEF